MGGVENSENISAQMSVKSTLANKSRSNRLYFDNLARQVAVELRLPMEQRDATWYNVLQPSYCSRIHGKPDLVTAGKTGCNFRPATEILNDAEISVISDFIATTPQCSDYLAAKMAMQVLFTDCTLTALNILIERAAS